MQEQEKLIVKYIIFKCLDHGFRINTAKLSYLLMIAQGYMLAINNKNLVSFDITIPVVGRLEIKEIEKEFIYGIAGFTNKKDYEDSQNIDNNIQKIIDEVINNYGGFELESLESNIVINMLQKHYQSKNKETVIPKDSLKVGFIEYFNYMDNLKNRKPKDINVVDFSRKR